MEITAPAPSKGIKLFGKYLKVSRDNLAFSWLVVLIVLPTALLGMYLSFLAIGKTLEFYTGFHYIFSFIAFLGLGIAISCLKPKAVFRVVNNIMWAAVQLISIYWVFKYSHWSDLQSVAYVITLALSYLSNIMNKYTPD